MISVVTGSLVRALPPRVGRGRGAGFGARARSVRIVALRIRGGYTERSASDKRELATGPELRQAQLVGELLEHDLDREADADRKSTRLNSSHGYISYAVFCLKKKKTKSCQ